MPKIRSSCESETEQLLADLCDKTFLKLWSYPNPYKNDMKELCDLLVVFGNHLFIFFDRERVLNKSDKIAPETWIRWKKRVIDKQIKTANGAEKYISNKRKIFVDRECRKPLPISIDFENVKIHKIIVAHGAKDACLKNSQNNINGSLAIIYKPIKDTIMPKSLPPFVIYLDNQDPVHVLDTHNLPIILNELDTVEDFSGYLSAKEYAIKKFRYIMYCGEEDLLADYFSSYDKSIKKYVIGLGCNNNQGLWIAEGRWNNFTNTNIYKNTKEQNKISYLWDSLIQRTCQNSLDGTLIGSSNITSGDHAIYYMAKEPRFIRREIMRRFMNAIDKFPDCPPGYVTRHVAFCPSFFKDVGYIFFQLWIPELSQTPSSEYIAMRRHMLEIACGAAKIKFKHLSKIIGFGMSAVKYSGYTNTEDIVLLECQEWTENETEYYEKENSHFDFFKTKRMKKYEDTITQFTP